MYYDDIYGEQQYLPNQEAVQQCKLNITSFKAHPVNTTNGRQHLVWNHLFDFYSTSEHSHKCQQQNKNQIL